MSEIVSDSIGGLLSGIISGTVAFLTVMLLSIVYRYFTNEKLSSFIAIIFGLGFLGFTGGLLAILDQPSLGGVIEIVAVTIFCVWGVNVGDKIAEKMPKKSLDSMLERIKAGKHSYTTVKLPDARLIYDVAGKPKVSDVLKAELSSREFTFSADIPLEELIKRVKRRLITDWGVADVELEMDQEGMVIHLAIAAKEQGISMSIPKGNVAIPIECQVIPSKLESGDFVKIYLDNNEVIERIEVKGLNEQQKVITVVATLELLEKIRGKKSWLVIALPSTIVPVYRVIRVKNRSGEIEDFQTEKIFNYLKKVGLAHEKAANVVQIVQDKLDKMDQPILTRIIKKEIIKEVEKDYPEIAKKFHSWKILNQGF